MKVVCVIGTRPEAIKMAPVLRELDRRNILRILIDTNQHPAQVMHNLPGLGDATKEFHVLTRCIDTDLFGRYCWIVNQLNGARTVYRKADVILAAGDTISVTAAAQAAFYSGIPFGHVEAGLRTWNMADPYPEETNRLLADDLATYFFCPTDQAAANLRCLYKREVTITGNTVIDALDYMMDKLNLKIRYDGPVLFTCHRRENWGRRMKDYFCDLRMWAKQHQELQILYPVHMNPDIKKMAELEFASTHNIKLVPPMPYPEMVKALATCRFIITDSGGLQEEACRLRKRVVLLRDRTERMEALHMGVVALAGASQDKFLAMCDRACAAPEGPDWAVEAYGDGKAAGRIVDYLVEKAQKRGKEG